MSIDNTQDIRIDPQEIDVDGILSELVKLKDEAIPIADTLETAVIIRNRASYLPGIVYRPSWNGKLMAASQQVSCNNCKEYECGR